MEQEQVQAQKETHKRMTQEPVGKLVCRMAGPAIISMLVTTFYQMADIFFIGQLRAYSVTEAVAAIGIVFAVMSFMQAIGFFFGQGSGSYISKALGRKDQEAAEKMAAIGFFSSLLAGVAILLLGLLFLRPFSLLVGSTETILPYTMKYMKIILLGGPFFCGSFTLNNQLRLQGKVLYAMIGIVSGAVINVGLDPVFIIGCHMGISGAALSTTLSQIIAFALLLLGYRKKGLIQLKYSRFSVEKNYYLEIVRGGFPSLARQGFTSLATISLNFGAGVFGDSAIAAMSIVSRVATFAASAFIGFGQGFQPVCGYNYGAGLYRRVKQSFWFCAKSIAVLQLFLGAAGFFLAPKIVGAFAGNDTATLSVGIAALRAQCVTFPLTGWVTISNMMQQNIGKVGKATFLAVARQGMFFIPLVLTAPHFLGLMGVWISQPLADVLTFFCAVPLQMSVLKELSGT